MHEFEKVYRFISLVQHVQAIRRERVKRIFHLRVTGIGGEIPRAARRRSKRVDGADLKSVTDTILIKPPPLPTPPLTLLRLLL